MGKLLVVLAVLLAPRPSDACSKGYESPFELFDRAAIVAVVKVVKAPWTGEVELAVTEQMKGGKRSVVKVWETGSTCNVGYKVGTTGLVFVSANGMTAGAFDGFITARRSFAKWRAVIAAYAAATTDGARGGVLVDAIATNADERIVGDAVARLADDPKLIAALSADQRKRLADHAHVDPLLTRLVLLRLRDARALAGVDTSVRRVFEVTRFEAVSDPAMLALAIDNGRGGGDPVRIAALERCERVHKVKLFDFARYVDGVHEGMWPLLADACRLGGDHNPESCGGHRSPFELYDEAAAVVRVKAGGTLASGRREFAVTHVIKGQAPAKFSSGLTGACSDSLDKEEAVVFLDKRGLVMNPSQVFWREPAKLEAQLAAWAAADVKGRASVLVDAIVGPDLGMSYNSASHLLDEPALLAATDAAQRKRIATYVKTRKQGWADSWYTAQKRVLVRLRDPTAATLPADDKLARQVAAITRFEALSDPAKLAAAIETATGPADQIAAFDRCERVRGARLWRFSTYLQPYAFDDRAKLAAACRTGTPITP